MRNPFPFAMAATACAVLLGAGCGSSTSTTSSNSAGGYRAASSTPARSAPSTTAAAPGSNGASGGTMVGTAHTSLGTVLVAGPRHLTVYLFAADKGPVSSCSQACAQVWPPVTTTGKPHVEGGAQAGDLGTMTRSDGSKQLTYKGHPLYYYASDQSSGETTGQGVDSFGAAWYVLNPQGQQVNGS